MCLPKSVRDMLDNLNAMIDQHRKTFAARVGDRRKAERRTEQAQVTSERRHTERRAGPQDRRAIRFSFTEPPFNPFDIKIP